MGIRVFKDEKVFNSIDQIDDANQLVDLRADPTDSNIIWVLTPIQHPRENSVDYRSVQMSLSQS